MKKAMISLSGIVLATLWLLGVHPVQANTNHTVGTTANDAKITSVLKTKLAYKATKNDFQGKTDISVTTNDGVVTLEGCVTTEKDKQLVETVAKETRDVVNVDDRLSIDQNCGA